MSIPYPCQQLVTELADALRDTLAAAVDGSGCTLYEFAEKPALLCEMGQLPSCDARSAGAQQLSVLLHVDP